MNRKIKTAIKGFEKELSSRKRDRALTNKEKQAINLYTRLLRLDNSLMSMEDENIEEQYFENELKDIINKFKEVNKDDLKDIGGTDFYNLIEKEINIAGKVIRI